VTAGERDPRFEPTSRWLAVVACALVAVLAVCAIGGAPRPAPVATARR